MSIPNRSTYSKAILILLLPILLQACSTTPTTSGIYRYTKADTTDTEYKKDQYECKRENTYVTTNNYQRVYVYRGSAYSSSTSYPSSRLDNENFRLCMSARGYMVESLEAYCSRKPYDARCSSENPESINCGVGGLLC